MLQVQPNLINVGARFQGAPARARRMGRRHVQGMSLWRAPLDVDKQRAALGFGVVDILDVTTPPPTPGRSANAHPAPRTVSIPHDRGTHVRPSDGR